MYTKSFQSLGQKAQWQLIDAGGQSLGRVASEVAKLLRGKHRSTFTPHADRGDFVIVINSGKVCLTGKKREDKKYYAHSGFMGGLKEEKASHLMKRKPEMLVRYAVQGMLPKNKLSRQLIKKLKVYEGHEHPHAAQEPKVFELKRKKNEESKANEESPKENKGNKEEMKKTDDGGLK